MKLLKIILLTVCILSTAVAFGQAAAGTNAISSQPVVYRGPSHPQQASSKPMAQQQTLLGQGWLHFRDGRAAALGIRARTALHTAR